MPTTADNNGAQYGAPIGFLDGTTANTQGVLNKVNTAPVPAQPTRSYGLGGGGVATVSGDNVTTTPAPTTTYPVISSNTAVTDYNKKQADFSTLQNQVAQQATKVAEINSATPTVQAQPTTPEVPKPDASPFATAVKRVQAMGMSDPETIAQYINTHGGLGLEAGLITDAAHVSAELALAEPAKTPEQRQALVDAQRDQAYNDYKAQVNQFMNGTLPLTADEQTQINNIQQQFDQLKAQQQLANRNYEGGLTNAGIAAGRNRYAPEIELGNIQAAITSGISKVAEIESKAASTIASMRMAFQDKNYEVINNSYKALNDYLNQKSSTIFQTAQNVREEAQLAMQQHTQAIADQKYEDSKSQAAMDFAIEHNVTKPFYLVGNTAINTRTGEPVDLATYQRLTGQQVGLSEGQTDFSHIQSVAQASKPVEVSPGNALVDPVTGKVIYKAPYKVTGGSGGSGGGGSYSGAGGAVGGNDLDVIVGGIANRMSVTAGNNLRAEYKNAKTDAQKIRVIMANANIPAAVKTEISQNLQVSNSLAKVEDLLNSGAQTGLLKAGQSYAANKVGSAGDKKVEEIKSRLIAAVQPYRNKVTGAAWGEQEEAEYQALVGSVKFSPEALLNKIRVFKDTLDDQSKTALLTAIDPYGSISGDSTLGSQFPAYEDNNQVVEYQGKQYRVDSEGNMTEVEEEKKSSGGGSPWYMKVIRRGY